MDFPPNLNFPPNFFYLEKEPSGESLHSEERSSESEPDSADLEFVKPRSRDFVKGHPRGQKRVEELRAQQRRKQMEEESSDLAEAMRRRRMKELAADVKEEPQHVPATISWEEPASPIVISDDDQSQVPTYGYSCYEQMLIDHAQEISRDIAEEPAQRAGRVDFEEEQDDQPEDVPPEEIAGRSFAFQMLKRFLHKE